MTDEGQTGRRLVVVGDYAWDVLIRAETRVLRGGDSFGEVALAPGGSAANVAVWARRCGTEVDFVGKVGIDHLGRLAHDDLAREGVTSHLVDSDTHRTGAVAVFIDADGQRSMVSGRGADHYLLPSDLPEPVLSAADHLHLTGWTLFNDPPRAAAIRCADLAHQAGATVSFDPSSFQLIEEIGVDAFLAHTVPLRPRLLLPNVDEARVLTGLGSAGPTPDPEFMARRLADRYPGSTVVLKLDAEGALVLDDGVATAIAPTKARAVDATGAGDSFAGAFLAHWLVHGDAVAAATFAAPVAAWVIARPGARPLPDGELTSLLSEGR